MSSVSFLHMLQVELVRRHPEDNKTGLSREPPFSFQSITSLKVSGKFGSTLVGCGHVMGPGDDRSFDPTLIQQFPLLAEPVVGKVIRAEWVRSISA